MAVELWESWARVGALLLVLVVAYGWTILVLRVAGKRTLAKLNAFDFVVTIALGSTLSSVILTRDLPLGEGLLAIVGLVALQFSVAWASTRSQLFARLVKSTPTALLVDGELRQDAMARCRVRRDEIAAAARKHGHADMGDVGYVILETDGTFSVLSHSRGGDALDGVDGVDRDRHRG